MKFYDVDKDYIKYLQSYDNQVPNIEYDGNNKFVCGIILTINGIDYYAPISHFNKKQQTNIPIYDRGRIISTVRFSFMFPAYSDILVEKNIKEISKVNKQYANLLNSEYIYCKTHEKELYDKAKSVYKIGCNENHKLHHTCCDFKLLEKAMINYRTMREVAITINEETDNTIESNNI